MVTVIREFFVRPFLLVMDYIYVLYVDNNVKRKGDFICLLHFEKGSTLKGKNLLP